MRRGMNLPGNPRRKIPRKGSRLHPPPLRLFLALLRRHSQNPQRRRLQRSRQQAQELQCLSPKWPPLNRQVRIGEKGGSGAQGNWGNASYGKGGGSYGPSHPLRSIMKGGGMIISHRHGTSSLLHWRVMFSRWGHLNHKIGQISNSSSG